MLNTVALVLRWSEHDAANDVMALLHLVHQIGSFCTAISEPNALLATQRGDLEVVELYFCFERALSSDGTMSNTFANVLNRAAACGHMHVLEWIHTKHPIADWRGVLDSAAERGQFGAVQWIHARHPESATPATIASAASSGSLPLLEWAHHRYASPSFCESSQEAMKRAAASGSLDIVEFLHRERGLETAGAAESAAQHGHLVILEWLYETRTMETSNSTWAPPKAVELAAAHGHLVVLQYLARRLPKKHLTKAVNAAAENGHLDVLQWLDKRNKVRVSHKSLRRVAQNGHLDVMQWLYASSKRYFRDRFGFSNLNLLCDAAEHGRERMVEWTLATGSDTKTCISEAIDGSDESGNTRISEILTDHVRAKGWVRDRSSQSSAYASPYREADDISDYGYRPSSSYYDY